MKTYFYIDREAIRLNEHQHFETQLPTIIVSDGEKRTHTAHHVEIHGPSTIKYGGWTNQLCGEAIVWVETDAPYTVT